MNHIFFFYWRASLTRHVSKRNIEFNLIFLYLIKIDFSGLIILIFLHNVACMETSRGKRFPNCSSFENLLKQIKPPNF